VLPESVFKDKFCNCELKPTLIRLKTYDGAIIKPIGKVELVVCYKSIKKKCIFIVVKSDNKPLIGRDIMKEINIGIYKLDSRKTTIGESKFNKLL